MNALAPWIGALLTIAAFYALGSLFLARTRITLLRAEKFPLAFVTGSALLHSVVFAILTLHLAYASVLVSVLAAILGAAIWTGDWHLPPRTNPGAERGVLPHAVRLLFFAIAGTFTVVYIFCAWAPEISPDGTAYHLPLIARYLHAHGFEPVPTSFYSTLSEGIELIFLPAFGIAGLFFADPASLSALAAQGSAASLVHLAFLIALALSIRAYGYRIGHILASEAAALLVYLSPVAGVVGTSAYVDLGTAAVVFCTFYWLQIWDDARSSAGESNDAVLVCIGLLGGYCYAAKYTAAIMVIYAAGYVLWHARRLRPVAVVASCATIMAVPWLLKDWIYVHNPIAPFANSIFRNPYIHPEFEREWAEYLRTYGSTDLWRLPWDVIVTGATTGNLLGPVFLILPVGLLALRKAEGRRILLPAALLCSTYFANIGARFLLPALPFLSLSITLLFTDLPLLLLVLIACHSIASWPRNLRRYVAHDAWALRRTPIQAALRRQSEDSYLSAIPNYRAARMIARIVPPGEKVLMTDGVAQFYAEHETLVSFEGAHNEQLQDVLITARDDFSQPSRATVFHFPEHPVRRLRVVQTATMPTRNEQWSVHEMRFFRGAEEIPRSEAWRLRAFPNPWGAGYAFDNSEVTRWRTWETAAPGNYIDVDFAAPVAFDQVRIESSADSSDVLLKLEEMDASGHWIPVAGANPTQLTVTPETSLRRAAGYELQANGIHYLLVRDSDAGAESYSKDPASWNFSVAGRFEVFTIYKMESGR